MKKLLTMVAMVCVVGTHEAKGLYFIDQGGQVHDCKKPNKHFPYDVQSMRDIGEDFQLFINSTEQREYYIKLAVEYLTDALKEVIDYIDVFTIPGDIERLFQDLSTFLAAHSALLEFDYNDIKTCEIVKYDVNKYEIIRLYLVTTLLEKYLADNLDVAAAKNYVYGEDKSVESFLHEIPKILSDTVRSSADIWTYLLTDFGFTIYLLEELFAWRISVESSSTTELGINDRNWEWAQWWITQQMTVNAEERIFKVIQNVKQGETATVFGLRIPRLLLKPKGLYVIEREIELYDRIKTNPYFPYDQETMIDIRKLFETFVNSPEHREYYTGLATEYLIDALKEVISYVEATNLSESLSDVYKRLSIFLSEHKSLLEFNYTTIKTHKITKYDVNKYEIVRLHLVTTLLEKYLAGNLDLAAAKDCVQKYDQNLNELYKIILDADITLDVFTYLLVDFGFSLRLLHALFNWRINFVFDENIARLEANNDSNFEWAQWWVTQQMTVDPKHRILGMIPNSVQTGDDDRIVFSLKAPRLHDISVGAESFRDTNHEHDEL